MTKRILPLIALGTVFVMAAASANTSVFDNIIDNGTLTTSGNVRFSAYTTGAALFNGSGLMSSVAPGTSGNLFTSNGSTWVSASPPSSGVTSLGAFGSSPNGNAGTIAGSVLTLQPADATNPGGVSTTTQDLAGAKRFLSTPTFSTMTTGSVLFAGTSGILAQDNANFFYDATTNNALLLGSTSQVGSNRLAIKCPSSSQHCLGIYPSSGPEYWTLTANGNDLYLWDVNSNRRIFDVTMTGQIAWGTAAANGAANLDNFLVKNANAVGATSTTFSVQKSTSQTGDLTDWYDEDGLTKLAKIDVTGALTVGVIGTTSGKVTFNGSTSSSVSVVPSAAAGNWTLTLPPNTGTSGQFLQTDGSGVSSWATGGSGTVTSLSVASANGFAGSFTASATPVLTLTTSINSPILAGNGTAISAATTTGSGSTAVLATAPTMTNPVVGTQSLGDNSTKAASTAFVQAALLQLNPAAAVFAASTANIAGTYTNAVPGVCVADTFTVTATGALSIDGQSPTLGKRVLLKDQSSGFQNGVWDVTVVGSIGVSPVLTRSLDWDNSADMNAGNLIPVINGTTNGNTVWYQTAAITTCSSDSQVYTQFSGGSSGACATPVLTKTTSYTVLTGDFTCASKMLMVEMNCTAACTLTFPAASNTGFDIKAINVGTGVATMATAGSDTFGSTADTTWTLNPLGDPQSSNNFTANGGTRWDGF